MSHLLEVMQPFQQNMDQFITLYEKVNNILQRITSGFGHEVTQEEYYRAARDGLSPLQAEYLLKEDFVKICEKLLK